MAKRTDKPVNNEIGLDFDRVTVQEYFDMVKAQQDHNLEEAGKAASKIVTRWPYETPANDPASLAALPFLKAISVLRTIRNSAENLMASAENTPGLVVDLDKWTGKNYQDFMAALRVGDLKEMGRTLGIVVSLWPFYELPEVGVEDTDGRIFENRFQADRLADLSLEKLGKLLGAVNVATKEAFSEGE